MKNKAKIIRRIITIVLLLVLVGLSIRSFWIKRERENLSIPDSLDQWVLNVDGNELYLRELAFYIGFEEAEVQKQAVAYDSSNPAKYWNLHMDGQFIRLAARNAALQMAIHDEIFYQKAVEEGFELNDEEARLLEGTIQDEWEDLTERDGQEALGITREDMAATLGRIALAQKYQIILAETENLDYTDFDFASPYFEEIREEHSIKINESLWSYIEFGKITVN